MARKMREWFGVNCIFRKITWQGRRSAPDRCLMIPQTEYMPGQTIWVELKKPGEKPSRAQLAEHARMRAAGQKVRIVASFADVEKIYHDFC